jgi:hypothetical protein
MNLIARLNTRLSRFSPTTIYLVGIGDGLILVSLAAFAGFIFSKVTQ